MIASYAGGQCAEFSLSVEADIGEPHVEGQVLAAAFAHHRGQAPGVLGGRGQCGTATLLRKVTAEPTQTAD